MIEAITAVGVTPAAQPLQQAGLVSTGSAAASESSFVEWVSGAVQGLDAQMKQAEGAATAYALGDAVPTHELMISMEKARHTLQLAVEVRNRLVEGYQEVARMQI